jgi:hypothetical protein
MLQLPLDNFYSPAIMMIDTNLKLRGYTFWSPHFIHERLTGGQTARIRIQEQTATMLVLRPGCWGISYSDHTATSL